MKPVMSDDLIQQVCDLLKVDPKPLTSLTLYLAVNEPALVETSFYVDQEKLSSDQFLLFDVEAE